MEETMMQDMKFHSKEDKPLKDNVSHAMKRFFYQIGDQKVSKLYRTFLTEVEEPLLKALMEYCRGNQCKAARVLGLSRGTLRKKLKTYGML